MRNDTRLPRNCQGISVVYSAHIFVDATMCPGLTFRKSAPIGVTSKNALQNKRIRGCETFLARFHPFRRKRSIHIKAVSARCVDRHLGLSVFVEGGTK